jgi:hypothetical protein
MQKYEVIPASWQVKLETLAKMLHKAAHKGEFEDCSIVACYETRGMLADAKRRDEAAETAKQESKVPMSDILLAMAQEMEKEPRVINPAPSKRVARQKVCNNCGVEVEYLPMHVKSRHGTDMGGGPDGAEWIECPKCKAGIILRSW